MYKNMSVKKQIVRDSAEALIGISYIAKGLNIYIYLIIIRMNLNISL